jgi:hypothetical protein
MEAILVLALLLTLAFAAPRWGADSRAGVESEESALAARGVVWEC